MKLLANENVPFSSITYLKSKGYDVKAIGIDHQGVTDEQVMQLAIAENRLIITYDSDYGELIFKHNYQPPAGVVFIRSQPSHPLDTAKIIDQLIVEGQYVFRNFLTVVDGVAVRQKRC